MKYLDTQRLVDLIEAFKSDISVDELILGFEAIVLYISEKYHKESSILIRKNNAQLDQQIYAIIEGFMEILPTQPRREFVLKALYQAILKHEPKCLFSPQDIQECYRLFYDQISEKKEIGFIPAPLMISTIEHPTTIENVPLFDLIDQHLQFNTPQQAIHLKGHEGKSFELYRVYRYLKSKKYQVTMPIHGLTLSFLEEIQCASHQKIEEINEQEFLLNHLFSKSHPLILLIDDLDWLSRDNALNLSLVLEKSNFPILLIFTAEYLLNQYSFLIKKSFASFTEYQIQIDVPHTTDEKPLDRYMALRQHALEKQHFIPENLNFELNGKFAEQIEHSELAEQILQATVMMGEIFSIKVLARTLKINQSLIKAQLDFFGFQYVISDVDGNEFYRFGSVNAWIEAYRLLRHQSSNAIDFTKLVQEIDGFYGENFREYTLNSLKMIARYLGKVPYEWLQETLSHKALDRPKLYLALNTLGAIISAKQSLLWTRTQVVALSRYLAQHAYQWNQVKESLSFLQIGVMAAKQNQDYASLIFLLMRSAKFYLLVQMADEALEIIEHITPLLLSLKRDEDRYTCDYYRIEALMKLKLLLSAFNEINTLLSNQDLPKVWQIRLLIKKSELELCFEQELLSRQSIQHAERLYLLLPKQSDPQLTIEFALYFQMFWVELKMKQRKKIEGLIKKFKTFQLDQYLYFIYHSATIKEGENIDIDLYQQALAQIKNTQHAHLVLKLNHYQLLGIFESQKHQSLDQSQLWLEELINALMGLATEAQKINDYIEYIQIQKSVIALKSVLIQSLKQEDLIRRECDLLLKMSVALISLSQDLSLSARFSDLKLGEQALFQKNRFAQEISFAFDLLYRLNTEEQLENQYLGIQNEAKQ